LWQAASVAAAARIQIAFICLPCSSKVTQALPAQGFAPIDRPRRGLRSVNSRLQSMGTKGPTIGHRSQFGEKVGQPGGGAARPQVLLGRGGGPGQGPVEPPC
jgi:hypothetical protein